VVDQTSFLDYTLQDGFLYRSNPLCVPAGSGRLTLIKEAHSSSYGGHFGTSRTLQHLQRYFDWSSVGEHVEDFIWRCSPCDQSKPSNNKFGLYQPLPVPSRPWESLLLYVDFNAHIRFMEQDYRCSQSCWVVLSTCMVSFWLTTHYYFVSWLPPYCR
jgi:hypothetical protein